MFSNCFPLTNIWTHQCYAALKGTRTESDSARWRCLLISGGPVFGTWRCENRHGASQGAKSPSKDPKEPLEGSCSLVSAFTIALKTPSL